VSELRVAGHPPPFASEVCASYGGFRLAATMRTRRRDPLARDLPAELQVAATNGSTLIDSRGRKYIDFVMGWCVGNFG